MHIDLSSFGSVQYQSHEADSSELDSEDDDETQTDGRVHTCA